MPADDRYARDLSEAAIQLRGAATKAVVLGDGNGRFVFAELNSRAIELSVSAEGWWVEFWENEQVSDERTYASCMEAVMASQSWLAGNAA